jgi:hypothetical protein
MGTANMIAPFVMGLGRSMVGFNVTVGAGDPIATIILIPVMIMVEKKNDCCGRQLDGS